MDYTVFEADLICSGVEVIQAEPISRHTTIGLGGCADYFAKPKTVIELIKCLELAKKHGVRFILLGRGSNVLVSDKGFRGLVVSTCDVDEINVERTTNQTAFVRAFCGVSLQALNAFCYKNGLTGLEFLSGIPGSVGGAVTMNAGFAGKSISDITVSVFCLSNGFYTSKYSNECGFEYRNSIFQSSDSVVISALFRTKFTNISQVKEKLALYKTLRKTPSGKSMGSIFKNGEIPAGKIIDVAGLKGVRIGGAYVSQNHANVIINDGSATSCEVYDLIKTIKLEVKEKFGLTLEEEIKYVGEF